MSALFGDAEDEVPVLTSGMVGVWNRRRMVIIEDLRRFSEADAVLLLVLPSFFWIPFEYQHCALNSNLTSDRPTCAQC